jgi:hypothetical protein
VDEGWKHKSILGKQKGMRLKTEAFMQQREREPKQRHEDNLRGHKQAEVNRFPVDSDIAMRSALCPPAFTPMQKPAKQVPPTRIPGEIGIDRRPGEQTEDGNHDETSQGRVVLAIIQTMGGICPSRIRSVKSRFFARKDEPGLSGRP